ncbi:ATP-dependent helicase HrpB [Wenxinia saemankumensis]|uniref:ATP-dependent helicase HrpB n=1 Tax=Wenxinia saemankumensis TaxID=1447782 RepID=A0A1M6CTL0_9RHOB|nr:ATP-dependent helicase HrpB [Wenxinia saemankumensis]SHI64290.1 ATP-dependent helicase HrpB [Wenxinia saemankumensis]
MPDALPIDAVLPDLVAALRARGRAVLEAPPGAGKTTRVPLALLEAGFVTGRILMLEPRRLAARAAAERLAEQLGEGPGDTVGYRMRGDTKTSGRTRIEVVTEGILTRMIQSDPELAGIGAVIFDEFHERSLDADLGLALCLEVRAALRPDLHLLVMSATLDAAPVAALMDGAPRITSEGRAYPVEIRHLDRPLPKGRIGAQLAEAVLDLLPGTTGGVLAFLPGAGEIRDAAARLSGRVPAGTEIRLLYGALPPAEQRAAIRPAAPGTRKIVLATSIAETSLTIEDVRVVVDGGLARRSRFDPGSGMARLVTERVTRAEAAQRAGRAGRVAEGIALRLWTKGEEGALAAYPPPGIESADLAPLALDLALWGSADLPFLTPPPEGALAEARALLRDLGALDGADRITAHGRALAAMPVHPRLAHMLGVAGRQAAPLAALLSDRDVLRAASSDLALRLRALKGDRTGEADPGALARVREESRRLARGLPDGPSLSPGAMAALAYPDRIGRRRPGEAPRFLLSGGKGAHLDPADPLAGVPFLVATDLDGDPREARIRAAAEVSEAEIRDLFAERIVWTETCRWSRREGRVVARAEERLGALVLADRPGAAETADLARAMCDGVRQLGLRLSPAAERLRARVALARAEGHDLPAMDETKLLETLEDWLAPYLAGVRTAEDWKRFDPLPALRARIDWGRMQALDAAAPGKVTTPTGREVPVDYSGEHPAIAVKLQEMFGTQEHPKVAGRPIQVTLLSPAQHPLAVTTDIPGFWSGAYHDVRRDMRGRYPRHPWPENPSVAEPTRRTKPRGT